MTRAVPVTKNCTVGSSRLTIIAGPCQIESREHCLKIATYLADLAGTYPINLIFKSSFDKANRSSVSGARGIGMDAGLKILAEMRKVTGLPILTDIHDESQVSAVAEVVDVLQIPAFLCRQTDLLVAAGKTGKTINVKKGQFLHPADMQFVAEKIASTGNQNILLCERGASFGYRDLIVDMRSLVIMKQTGYPVIFDATHSVQSMGSSSGKSGGSREFVGPLSRGAVAVGVDGLFLECHDNPDKAPSDAASMIPLDWMPKLISDACALFELTKTSSQVA